MLLGHLSTRSRNIFVDWSIEYFLQRMDKYSSMISPKFLLFDASFYLSIKPKGGIGDCKGWMTLQLCKESSPSDVYIKYKVGLKKGGSRYEFFDGSTSFPSKGGEYDYSPFIMNNRLIVKQYLCGYNGILTVFCELDMLDDLKKEPEPVHSNILRYLKFSRDFETLFKSGCHSDVVINVKGKKFSAHKCILSSRSSVFRSMFEIDMKEKKTGSVNIIDCDPEAFQTFLLFLYGGHILFNSTKSALDLYMAAEKYNVQSLKEMCREFMMSNLSVDLVCDVLRLAELHGDQELLTYATVHFVQKANEILKTPKWQAFVVENFTLANKLLIQMAKKIQM